MKTKQQLELRLKQRQDELYELIKQRDNETINYKFEVICDNIMQKCEVIKELQWCLEE